LSFSGDGGVLKELDDCREGWEGWKGGSRKEERKEGRKETQKEGRTDGMKEERKEGNLLEKHSDISRTPWPRFYWRRRGGEL
jgi:hypothetical protein